MERDSFIFYKSWSDTIRTLKTNAERVAAYEAIITYALSGEEPEIKRESVRLIFSMAKAQIDANTKRYLNGCKGGAPKGSRNNPNGRKGRWGTNQELTEKQPKNNQKTTKKQPNDNANANANANDDIYSTINGASAHLQTNDENEDGKAKKPVRRFTPPTEEEVRAEMERLGYHNFSAEAFVNFYTSNGWKVGRNPMKDWKAALRTWQYSDIRNNNRNQARNDNGNNNASLYDRRRGVEPPHLTEEDFENDRFI